MEHTGSSFKSCAEERDEDEDEGQNSRGMTVFRSQVRGYPRRALGRLLRNSSKEKDFREKIVTLLGSHN